MDEVEKVSCGCPCLTEEKMKKLKQTNPQLYEELKTKYAQDNANEEHTNEWEDDGIHEFLEDWFVHNEDPQDNSFQMEKKEAHLKEEALKPLYPQSCLTRLSASLLLLNLQAQFGWSNTLVTALLE